jgi:exonuclease SbcD
MIEKLPKRGRNDEGEAWPYLELKVEEKQPEPTLLHQITTSLEDKAVYFCRVVRVYQQDHTATTVHKTSNTLQTLTPIEMADLIYQDKYNSPLPDELKQRLLIAEEYSLSESLQ